MVDGRRIHRVIGRESSGTTRTQAEGFIERARQDAKHNRLSLPTGRKVALSFTEAADRYVEELTRNRGKAADKRVVADPTKLTTQATINRELAVLSHLLNRAVEWGWIPSMPVRMRRFPEPPTRIDYLTASEISRLLKAAATDAHPQIYAFIVIALRTAMRLGEVLSLRREYLDFERTVIHLPRAKTGARDVPMSGTAKVFLARQLRSDGGNSPWLFPSTASKSGHTEDIAKAWRRVISAAGLVGRRITPHTLRHTAITHLVQAGVDLPTVQRVSGHKTVAMVLRYSHQNQDHVQAALRKLDRRIRLPAAPRSQPVHAASRNYTGITQRKRTRGGKSPQVPDLVGRPCRDRTYDQRIKSPLLYQLS